jgi:DNA polymerase-3 subunit alpha
LSQLVPLYRDPRSDMPVTQFDMKHVEDQGLVKFDFLGLKTLSVLRKAVDLLKRRNIEIDLDTLPWDDPGVFDLLKRGDTVGVFQLESEGMRRTLTAVKPTKFEDIIALVSLYRPGPMDNIPSFGKRKAGEEEIVYPHSKLAGILEETYGIFVYQEQVMQAAQILAGYSLGDADLLRRAMGKKNQAEMDKQRARFAEGCKEVSGIEEDEANRLFDVIDKFAGYGFNKSHAAAYALLSYQTAWLKAHYPEEFYAASMCFDMHQSEKLAVFVDDLRRNGVELLGPDIARSEAEFSVEETDTGHAVRYALAGIRNVGEKAMDQVVAEREAHGPFESLEDVFQRLPSGSMNRKQLEGLAGAGAFDRFEPNRAKVLANADMLLAVTDAANRERSSGQGGLFGGEDDPQPDLRLTEAEAWSRSEQMAVEKDVFGFYFAAHPVQEFREVASANGARTYASLMESGVDGGRAPAVMAAMVESVNKGRTKRGAEFIRADFSDSSGQFSAACFDETLVDSFVQWAQDGTCVLLNVELDSPNPDDPPRVTVRGARPLAEVKSTAKMQLTAEVHQPEAIAALADMLEIGRAGHGEVVLHLRIGEDHEPRVLLGSDFKLGGDMVDRLSTIPGLTNVAITPIRGVGHLRLVA